jgi:hypothetical protein
MRGCVRVRNQLIEDAATDVNRSGTLEPFVSTG